MALCPSVSLLPLLLLLLQWLRLLSCVLKTSHIQHKLPTKKYARDLIHFVSFNLYISPLLKMLFLEISTLNLKEIKSPVQEHTVANFRAKAPPTPSEQDVLLPSPIHTWGSEWGWEGVRWQWSGKRQATHFQIWSEFLTVDSGVLIRRKGDDSIKATTKTSHSEPNKRPYTSGNSQELTASRTILFTVDTTSCFRDLLYLSILQ